MFIAIQATAFGKSDQIQEGTIEFRFDPSALAELGFSFVSAGEVAADPTQFSFAFEVDADLTNLAFSSARDDGGGLSGTVASCGALLLDRPGVRVVIGNLILRGDGHGVQVLSTLDASRKPYPVFDVVTESPRFIGRRGEVAWRGELYLSADWARELAIPGAEGTLVGRIELRASLDVARSAAHEECSPPADRENSGGVAGEQAIGSDVIVSDLQSVLQYPSDGDIAAFAVGTTACNLGTQRASWVGYTNQHPVIVQGLFRLKDDHFAQIGMSWVKHGFFAVSESFCGPCLDATNGSQLGIGCSDPYSASLNGVQTNMSPRATVNAHTGYFPYPWNGPAPHGTVERRIQVHLWDFDPSLNPSARYFIEGHYVHPDDCRYGTQDNNASYREVSVVQSSPGVYTIAIDPTKQTQRERPAIRAWHDLDPTVVETDVRVPGEGLFIVAAKAWQTNNGYWRYVYAVQNLNSDRSGRSWTVQIPTGAVVENVQFSDVDYHSGEPYIQEPWIVVMSPNTVTWQTDTFASNPNANALRFDTLYTYSFDVNADPGEGKTVLGLFKPGLPEEIPVTTLGPRLTMIDCQPNGIEDRCDIDCSAIGCSPPCGGSADCNSNQVPDECEQDCNNNGIADECDVTNCPEGETWCTDCNANMVPDICENDCDHDGIIDDCETVWDTDGDGLTDCEDECPYTTPPNACLPPLSMPVVCCFSNGLYMSGLTWGQCQAIGGMAVCDEPVQCPGTPCPVSMCRQGCLIGDADGDGDLDFADFAALQRCFGIDASAADLIECTHLFDFNDDVNVGSMDYKAFQERCLGPR